MDMNGKCTPPSWAGVDPRIADARVEKAVYAAGQPMAPLTLGEVQLLANEVDTLARQVRELSESVHTMLFAEPAPMANTLKGPIADPGIGLARLRSTLQDVVGVLVGARRVLEETHGRVSQ